MKNNKFRIRSTTKYTWEIMTDGEQTLIALNSKMYTIEEAIEKARIELELADHIELEFFESYVEFGYWSDIDGEVYNGWNIRSMNEPVEKKRNSVKVIVVKRVSKTNLTKKQ